MEEPIAIENTDDLTQDMEIVVGDYAKRLERQLLQNIPCWQHLLVQDVFEYMGGEVSTFLISRYHIH